MQAHMKYELEVVDHQHKVRKVVTHEHIAQRKRKEKVVGEFCIMISFILFSTDVFIMFLVYPKVWSLFGCCGILGMIFLIMMVVCWNVDQVKKDVYKMKSDLEKYLRSGKLVMLIFCLLFLFLIYFVLKYVF